MPDFEPCSAPLKRIAAQPMSDTDLLQYLGCELEALRASDGSELQSREQSAIPGTLAGAPQP